MDLWASPEGMEDHATCCHRFDTGEAGHCEWRTVCLDNSIHRSQPRGYVPNYCQKREAENADGPSLGQHTTAHSLQLWLERQTASP